MGGGSLDSCNSFEGNAKFFELLFRLQFFSFPIDEIDCVDGCSASRADACIGDFEIEFGDRCENFVEKSNTVEDLKFDDRGIFLRVLVDIDALGDLEIGFVPPDGFPRFCDEGGEIRRVPRESVTNALFHLLHGGLRRHGAKGGCADSEDVEDEAVSAGEEIRAENVYPRGCHDPRNLGEEASLVFSNDSKSRPSSGRLFRPIESGCVGTGNTVALDMSAVLADAGGMLGAEIAGG